MRLFGIRWRFYGAAQPRHGWKAAVLLFAVYAVAVYSGVMWCRSVDNSTAFWGANGVITAGLLLLPRRMGWTFAAVCIALNAAVNVLGELPPNLNLFFTGLNLVYSVAIAGLVRTFCGAAMDLGRLRRFLPFIAVVAIASVFERSEEHTSELQSH